jgi:uncharacterized protein
MAETANRINTAAAVIGAAAAAVATLLAIGDRFDWLAPRQASPRAVDAGAPARPSFACNLPAQRYRDFERAICDSAELSRIDRELQDAYAAARRRGDAARNAILKSGQLAWMESRAGCGTDEACLLAIYRQRIDALAGASR